MDSPPEALFTEPDMVTFWALTTAGKTNKMMAARRANLFIRRSFGQILAKIGIVAIIKKF